MITRRNILIKTLAGAVYYFTATTAVGQQVTLEQPHITTDKLTGITHYIIEDAIIKLHKINQDIDVIENGINIFSRHTNDNNEKIDIYYESTVEEQENQKIVTNPALNSKISVVLEDVISKNQPKTIVRVNRLFSDNKTRELLSWGWD
jgi:hypothetical protein